MLNFVGYCKITFQTDHSNLHSQQQCLERFSCSASVPVFGTCGYIMLSHCSFNLHVPISYQVLFAIICILWQKYLFKSHAHLYWLFSFFLYYWGLRVYMFCIQVLYQLCVLQIFSLSLCLPFHSLNIFQCLSWTETYNFDEAQFTNFFYELCFQCHT